MVASATGVGVHAVLTINAVDRGTPLQRHPTVAYWTRPWRLEHATCRVCVNDVRILVIVIPGGIFWVSTSEHPQGGFELVFAHEDFAGF